MVELFPNGDTARSVTVWVSTAAIAVFIGGGGWLVSQVIADGALISEITERQHEAAERANGMARKIDDDIEVRLRTLEIFTYAQHQKPPGTKVPDGSVGPP